MMAEELRVCDLPSNPLKTFSVREDDATQQVLSPADVRIVDDGKASTPRSGRPAGIEEPPPAFDPPLTTKSGTENHQLGSKMILVRESGDKENVAASPCTGADAAEEERSSDRSSLREDNAAEAARRAQEEGRVSVVFPGPVSQDGCCRFVSEILKCVLYQRQQLPMTYDQLVYSQKKQQEEHAGSRRPGQSRDLAWRRCQQTLQELEEVLQQLEVLFSLSRVPRVLLLLGGSVVLPKELYEIDMAALAVASGDRCLRVSACLRQLFHTLFVADLLSDVRPVRLMPTTVLALAHRNCGAEWFRPKLQFKVPTRVKRQVIALSSESTSLRGPKDSSDWQDYVWFQAPMTIKGFSK